jgi:hypothetical protein
LDENRLAKLGINKQVLLTNLNTALSYR